MAKAKKNAAEAPEAAQGGLEPQEVSQDIQGLGVAFGAPEGSQDGAVTQEIVGPEDESELLGCQEDEAELAEGVLVEYAVTAKGGLRLRTACSLDAPVVAVLPCGAGVFGDGSPAKDGWRRVFTGRLSGWMMNRHLEPTDGGGHVAG